METVEGGPWRLCKEVLFLVVLVQSDAPTLALLPALGTRVCPHTGTDSHTPTSRHLLRLVCHVSAPAEVSTVVVTPMVARSGLLLCLLSF